MTQKAVVLSFILLAGMLLPSVLAATHYGVAEEGFVHGIIPVHQDVYQPGVGSTLSVYLTADPNTMSNGGPSWGQESAGLSVTVTSNDPASVTVDDGVSNTRTTNSYGRADFTITPQTTGVGATLTISSPGKPDRIVHISAAGSNPALTLQENPSFTVSEETVVTVIATENGVPVANRAISLEPSNGWVALVHPVDVPTVLRQNGGTAYPTSQMIRVMTDSQGRASFGVVPQMPQRAFDLTFSSPGYSDLVLSDQVATGSLQRQYDNEPEGMTPMWRSDGSHRNWARHGWWSKGSGVSMEFLYRMSLREAQNPMTGSPYITDMFFPELNQETGGSGKASVTGWDSLSTVDDFTDVGTFYYRLVLRKQEAAGKLAYIFFGDQLNSRAGSNREIYPTWEGSGGMILGTNGHQANWDQGVNNRPFEGKFSENITVEIIVHASSAVGADDGWIDVYVDGEQAFTDSMVEHTADGVNWYGSALSNSIVGMDFYNQVSSATFPAHTWQIYEMYISGAPVLGDDGTSHILAGASLCEEGATRTSGSNVGVCSETVETCIGGIWTVTAQGQGPVPVTCVEQDNNCNGIIDTQEEICGGEVLAGDVNSDGVVNVQDLLILVDNFRRTSTHTSFDTRADRNSDGVVNVFDLVLVAREFGRGSPVQQEPTVFNEPEGFELIYYTDGSASSPHLSTGAGYGGPGWTSLRDDGSGDLVVALRSDEELAVLGYPPNPTGSGYSLEFYHPEANNQDMSPNWNVLFADIPGVSDGPWGELYMRMTINMMGNPCHGTKLAYVSFPGDGRQNDFYPTIEISGNWGTLARPNIGSNRGSPSPTGSYIIKDSSAGALSEERAPLYGKESQDMTLEYRFKASSSVDVPDGEVDFWVDDALLAYKDWYGYNQPWDGEGSARQLHFNIPGVSLSNAFDGMIWQNSIQNSPHENGCSESHTWLVREFKVMGKPVAGNDGSSYIHDESTPPSQPSLARPNEPEGMMTLYENDGSTNDVVADGWSVGSSPWYERVQVIQDATNPLGSGYSLELTHPPFDGNGAVSAGVATVSEWSDLALAPDTAGPMKEVYLSYWLHFGGDKPHGGKLWYLGLEHDAHSPPRTKTNDWYTTWEWNGGSKVTLQGLSIGNQNVWIDPAPFTGKDNQWVHVEQHTVASSGHNMSDGIVRLWVDGELALEKTDWVTGDPASSAQGYLLDGMQWYNTVSQQADPGHSWRVGGLYISGKLP